ncbi:GGDEF domain-containing protein [Gorillibacterium timonense]|uniref:GGDEF domain-containing protein n=1 Tax=Gorillibacterium timonense TaxID=1689269 RepID=UPI00071CCC53|nr:diguanylate cyclase [Gorillibacterium timonense]
MNELERVNVRKWNRKILNAYWTVTFLVAFSTLLGSFLLPHADHYLSPGEIFPLLLVIFILLAAEVAQRKWKSIHPLMIISLGIVISLIVIPLDTNPGNIVYYAFLPILVSIFYFRKTYTFGAAIISLIGVTVLHLLDPSLRESFVLEKRMDDLLAYLAGLTILLLFIDRVKQLMQDLSSALDAKRELMVRSILMDKLVKTDPLTGLYTHTSFHDYLEELIEQNKRMPFSIHLAVIDVDDFKKFNDTYGHRLGDLALAEVSRLISRRIGPDDFAARCGGEEFSILFLEKKPEHVYATVEKIRKQITEISIPGHPEVKVSVSIGLKEYDSLMTKDQFFKEADDSMYVAKSSGKNRIIRDLSPGRGRELSRMDSAERP